MSQLNPYRSAKVIGEGTYGCIHDPSLKCKNNNVDYKGKISKVSFTNEMANELKEYDVMKKIDKKLNYHLGSPVLCEFDKDSIYNKKSLEKCNFYDDIVEAVDDSYDSEDSDASVIIPDLSLLVMKNGGIDLEKFIDTMHKEPVNGKNIAIVENALLEFHRIFVGLKKIINNNVIHHDLKPQNIVFDAEQKRMNFIDFGMMTDVSKIIKEAKKSNYNFSVHHWSFPFESKFYNRDEFNKVVRMTENDITNYFIDIARAFIENSPSSLSSHNNKKNETMRARNTLKTLFSYVINDDENNEKFIFEMNKYFTELMNTMSNDMKHMTHEEFIDKSLKTFDVFGVGIACVYFCNKLGKFMNNGLKISLNALFGEMIKANFNERLTVDGLINWYEIVLESHGILRKFEKIFKNHVLVDAPKKKVKNVAKLVKVVNSLDKNDVFLSKKERDAMSIQDVLQTDDEKCDSDKIMNPLTNRCVKMCDELHERDDSFVCVKRCGANQRRNLKTRRCNNVGSSLTKKRRAKK